MKYIVFLTIVVFFSMSFCSEKTLSDFFSIENSDQRIVTINDPNYSYKSSDFLHPETQELLKKIQSLTYGFCYAGMLYNAENPKLALINHCFPYFLNLQICVPSKSLKNNHTNIVVQSSNIDPTFNPYFTKKAFSSSDNSTYFWQTSIYRHTDTKTYSSSSFWGPFFVNDNTVGCFFYTNVSYIDDYAQISKPYIISYYTLDSKETKINKTCYVCHNGTTWLPLFADQNNYFTILLAIFFPSMEYNNKKVFFTNRYTSKKLLALKHYINSFKKKNPLPTESIQNCIQNSTIYALFLHNILRLESHSHFYHQINKKLDLLISFRQKNYT